MVKAILLIMVAAAAPAFADQSSPAPNRSPRFGTQRLSQNDPYKKLFAPMRTITPPTTANVSEAKSKVVCGMRVIPADPSIDPKIVLPPASDGIDYTLRAIDPAICSIPK